MLHGRTAVCRALDSLVGDVRAARSRTMVLRGEAGVGKTALLDYLGDRASGCRVVRVSGVESEMELPFAGLHQLCGPLMDRIDVLPGPQRDGLRVAFGLAPGERPERLMVGLGVLSLLAGVAEEQPVLCLVDDAQWLDRASVQALVFLARRLLAEPVGLVVALREPSDDPSWSDLPEMVLDGLSDEDARALLASVAPGPFDEQVRDRIISESRGNPLALLELHRAGPFDDVAAWVAAPESRSLSRRIEQSFGRRLDVLPPATRRLVLLAAAEPVGDAALLWRAVGEQGLEPTDLVAAVDAELIRVGATVRFRHPLVRSLIYREAAPEERRAAHVALARATDPAADPDRRAWHRALSCAGVDDEVADELERAGLRAQARGGIAAAAGFIERALELTADPARRSDRALAAAELRLQTGALDRASELLTAADLAPHDELQGARLEHVRARVVFTRQRGRDAPALLLHAAQHFERVDPHRAREVYLDALLAAGVAGQLGEGLSTREIALAARAAPPPHGPTGAVDLLFEAVVARYLDGYAASVGPAERALHALAQLDDEESIRWGVWDSSLTIDLWLDARMDERSRLRLAAARRIGALSALPQALSTRIACLAFGGELAQAESLVEELFTISRATGVPPPTGPAVRLAAWREQPAVALSRIDDAKRDADARGDGWTRAMAESAAALVHAGVGRADLALASLEAAPESAGFGLFGTVHVEIIEAAVRTGDIDRAHAAFERLAERTAAAGTDWSLGLQARSAALLSGGAEADELHQEAVERLARTRIVSELARSHLVYGEWLRRENRRIEAREQLRAALVLFDGMGAEAFAERARRELAATGETVRKRADDARIELTPQERQIADLVADGHTNPEIAAQLFLSARTVEWHLHKVFSKLGITSRRELRQRTAGRR
jgi:DNA-binding CsgD family transcriptional regulator